MDYETREEIRILLESLVGHLIDQPDSNSVSFTQTSQTTVYEISVDKDDRGKIIGKKGAMILALRHVIYAIAAKNKIRAILEICE